jgi:hypothetical protein
MDQSVSTSQPQPQEVKTQEAQSTETTNQLNILDVDVTDENIALNLIVNFVNIAQKRGVYSLPESSKIWECVQRFQKK